MTEDAKLREKFFSIIDSLGITANIMISPAHSNVQTGQHHAPLVLKWGYVEDIEGVNEFFDYVASTFKSPISWKLKPFTRKANIYPNGFANWWLFSPKRIDDIIEKYGLSRHEAKNWLCENEPEFGIQTNEELYNFIRHLDICYNDWVKKGKLQPIDQ